VYWTSSCPGGYPQSGRTSPAPDRWRWDPRQSGAGIPAAIAAAAAPEDRASAAPASSVH